MDFRSRRSAMVPVLLVIAGAGVLDAHGIDGVTIAPKAPTTDDQVVFTVKGYFSDLCDRDILGGEALASIADGKVTLWILVEGPADGGGCLLPAIRPFQVPIAGGRFPFGTFGIDVRLEIHEHGEIDSGDFPGVGQLVVGAGTKPPEAERVEVDPPHPGAADPVSATALMTVVECIARVDKTTATVEGNRIRIEADIYVPPALCPARPQALEAPADLGPLPPGDYTVDVAMVFFFHDPFWTGEFPGVRSFTVAGGGAPPFRRGDCTADGSTDLSDVIAELLHFFVGPAVACRDACDADSSGALDLTDAIFLLEYLFLDGPAPGKPFPECGIGPASDPSACVSFPGCG